LGNLKTSNPEGRGPGSPFRIQEGKVPITAIPRDDGDHGDPKMKANLPSTIYQITNLPNYHILSAPFARRLGTETLVVGHFESLISSLRDERLPKGPRFAHESLDADTGSGSVFSN
jgi:hypothetical protein